MDLENIFDKTLDKRQSEARNYVLGLKEKWDKYLKGAQEVYEKISFLRDKGYTVTIKYEQGFSEKLAREGSYPNVRVNNVTMIEYLGPNLLLVSGLGKFSLMGERHTYESFIKNLVQ